MYCEYSDGVQQQSIANPQGRSPRTSAVTAHELMFKPVDVKSGSSSLMNNLLLANKLRGHIVMAGKTILLSLVVFITVVIGRL